MFNVGDPDRFVKDTDEAFSRKAETQILVIANMRVGFGTAAVQYLISRHIAMAGKGEFYENCETALLSIVFRA